MMRQLKQILTLLMTIVFSGTLSAQTSVSAKADNDLKEFEAQYHAGANSAQLYETLYSAYESYRKIADKNPKDRTAQNGLRKIYPYLVDGAVYYSSIKRDARAADFASAYIDIPLMQAFRMERFSRDRQYPQLCYIAAVEAYKDKHDADAFKYGKLYLNSGDGNSILKQNIVDMFTNIANMSIKNTEYSLAERVINELDSQLPNNEGVLHLKARLAFNKDDLKNATQYYGKLYQTRTRELQYNIGYATASYNYALDLMKGGKSQLAKEYIDIASRIFEELSSASNITPDNRQKYRQNHLKAKGLLAELNKGNGSYFASTGTPSQTNNLQSSSNGYTTPQQTERPLMPNSIYMSREEIPTLDEFAEDFIKTEFERWKERGRYEPTADYAARVTTENAEKKKSELKQIAMDKYIAEYSSKIRLDNLRLENYDADNQTFLLISPDFGNIVLPVPRNEAEAFEKQWHTVSPEYPQFGIASNDHKLALAQLTFRTNNGNRYISDPNADFIDRNTTVNIDIDDDDLNIDDIITGSGLAANRKIKSETITVGGSDVDIDIPVTKKKNENLFAIIIANEDYENESDVSFAHNDGTMFKTYCIKTLGANDNNVHFVKDATLGNIRKEIRWITTIADAFQGECQIILYYAGHGVPDEASKSAYLLPTDGTATDIESGYKLDELYATLGNLPAKSVTVFLDACFSGAQRSGDPMESKKNSRAPIIKAKASVPQGKMTVFSAATGDETAFPYEEQKHGMFTYFLLKKLKESKGDVSYGELSDYISKNVKRNSITINQKSQTPTTISSTSVTEDEWRKWKFRN